tara:strand:+ start:1984 stop:3492 length:1509 start_codon:yes stop_codon:yes gene_type:complete
MARIVDFQRARYGSFRRGMQADRRRINDELRQIKNKYLQPETAIPLAAAAIGGAANLGKGIMEKAARSRALEQAKGRAQQKVGHTILDKQDLLGQSRVAATPEGLAAQQQIRDIEGIQQGGMGYLQQQAMAADTAQRQQQLTGLAAMSQGPQYQGRSMGEIVAGRAPDPRLLKARTAPLQAAFPSTQAQMEAAGRAETRDILKTDAMELAAEFNNLVTEADIQQIQDPVLRKKMGMVYAKMQGYRTQDAQRENIEMRTDVAESAENRATDLLSGQIGLQHAQIDNLNARTKSIGDNVKIAQAQLRIKQRGAGSSRRGPLRPKTVIKPTDTLNPIESNNKKTQVLSFWNEYAQNVQENGSPGIDLSTRIVTSAGLKLPQGDVETSDYQLQVQQMATDLMGQAGTFEAAAGNAVRMMEGATEAHVNNPLPVLNGLIGTLRDSIEVDKSTLQSIENYGSDSDLARAAQLRKSLTIKESYLQQASSGNFDGLVRFYMKVKSTPEGS